MLLLDIPPRRYITLFSKLESLTSKLQRIASSIAFIKQSFFHGVISTFSKVQFLNESDRWKSSEIILKSQLHKVLFYKLLDNLDLTLSQRRPISYQNQSINLLCKSMDWFLYDISLHRERVKYTQNRKHVSVISKKQRIVQSIKIIKLQLLQSTNQKFFIRAITWYKDHL